MSPPPNTDKYLDADNDDFQPKYRHIDTDIGPASPSVYADRREGAPLHLQIGEEPVTFAEVVEHEPWHLTMAEELKSIESNKTWRLVPLPAGHQPIGLKWVYKLKEDATNKVIKHKARLVAKGYIQQPGMDFEEVFTPVARIESVRLLLALVAQEGWPVHHMDVKPAFLNGDLHEEVYVCQPPGFAIASKENLVLRVTPKIPSLKSASNKVRI
jgi:hypothetical protein